MIVFVHNKINMNILNKFNCTVDESVALLRQMTCEQQRVALQTWQQSLALIENSLSNNQPSQPSNADSAQMQLSVSPVLSTVELVSHSGDHVVYSTITDVKETNKSDVMHSVYDNVCSVVEVPPVSNDSVTGNDKVMIVTETKTEDCHSVSEVRIADDASSHKDQEDDLCTSQVDGDSVISRYTSPDIEQTMAAENEMSTQELTYAVGSIETKTGHPPMKHDANQITMAGIAIEEHCDSSEDTEMAGVESADGGDWRKPTEKHAASTERFKCEVCGKVLSNSSNLKVHMRVHSGAHPFKCSICDKAFSIRPNMLRHERTHLGLKPWQCSECDKCFTEKKSLTVHCRTHTGERPFKCKSCGKSFAQAGTLQSHIHVHTGWKGHLCDLCGKPFRQKSQLRLHRLRHTNVRTYKCTVCSRSFISKGELDRHGLMHTGERPYLCSLCPKRFTRLSYLKDHINQHTGDHPYRCAQCNAAFQDRSTYSKHLKQQQCGATSAAAAAATKLDAEESASSFIMYLDPVDITQLADENNGRERSLIESLLQQGHLNVDGMLPQVMMNAQTSTQTSSQLTTMNAENCASSMEPETEQATDSIKDEMCNKRNASKSIVRTILTSL